MGASEVTVNAYILYAFMGVIALLLITLLGAVFRMLFVLGEMKGEIAAIWRTIGDIRQEIASVRQEVAQEIGSVRQEVAQEIGSVRQEIAAVRQEIASVRLEINDLREQIAQLRERVAENRGLLLNLHQRIDLLMRHRHDDDTGDVVLTPAAPDSQAVAD